MPAFTFEKIEPPVPPEPASPVVKQQRGVLVQILDRLAEKRVKRKLGEERAIVGKQKTSK
jgi:hypothetical protein